MFIEMRRVLFLTPPGVICGPPATDMSWLPGWRDTKFNSQRSWIRPGGRSINIQSRKGLEASAHIDPTTA
jgi:hypothetical protein